MKGKENKKSKSSKPKTKKVTPAKVEVKEAAVKEVQVKKVEVKEKKVEKQNYNTIKIVKICGLVLGLILILVGFFATDYTVPFSFFGVMLIAISGIINAVNSKKYPITKSLLVMVLSAVVLTWLIPNGYFSGTEFLDYGLKRTGLTDLPTIAYYANYFSLDKILFIVMTVIFYAFVSKIDAYKGMVNSLAKKLEGKEKIVAVSIITIFVLLTTLITQSLVVVFFVPFVISVLSKLKFDKMTAFAVTFGSILIGTIGATYGTDGIGWFSNHTTLPIDTGLSYRIVIELAAYVLFVLFVTLRLNSNKKDDLAVVNDPFEIDEMKNEKTVVYPFVIIMSIMTVFLILGYINWYGNFEIETFNNFHTWLMELSIGEDFYIFANILGSTSSGFGNWDLLVSLVVISVTMLVVALAYKINLNTIIDNIVDGCKKSVKPVLLLVLVFAVFVASYVSPFIGTFSNWLFDLTTTFEPNLTAVSAFFASVFHADLGYTGYIVGPYITSALTENSTLVYVIYTSMYGLVQVFVPTSLILVLGLFYTKVNYKDWLKYIWMFLIGITVILFVLFNVVVYL